MSVRLIVFDFDGTLVDTAAAFAAALPEVVRSKVSQEQVRSVLSSALTERSVFVQLLEAFEGPERAVTPEKVEAFQTAVQEAFPAKAKLYPGAYRLLMDLERRGIARGVVGNWPLDFFEEIIAYTGLAGYVDPVVSLPEAQKRQEDVGQLLVDASGVKADELLLVSSNKTLLELAHLKGIPTGFAAYGYSADSPTKTTYELERLLALNQLIG